MLNLNTKKPETNLRSIGINIQRKNRRKRISKNRVEWVILVFVSLQFNDPFRCWEASGLFVSTYVQYTFAARHIHTAIRR
jgi:hypothetical protein